MVVELYTHNLFKHMNYIKETHMVIELYTHNLFK